VLASIATLLVAISAWYSDLEGKDEVTALSSGTVALFGDAEDLQGEALSLSRASRASIVDD
jgi:hypothetical protein